MPPSSKIRSLREEALSGSSTRSSSRARTPNPDGEENGSLDVNFQSIEELLANKLEHLQSVLGLSDLLEHENKDKKFINDNKNDHKQQTISELNKSRIQSDLTTINQIIYSLTQSRTDVSSQSRELLLAQLYRLVVTKPIIVFNEEHAGTKEFVSESKVEELIQNLYGRNFRSESEFILLFRSIIGLLSSDLEEFGELVSSQLFSTIEKLIQDQPTASVTNDNKAGLISGYCGLLLILYAGTSAYGIDEKINWLFELAQGYVESALTLKSQLDSGDREYSTLLHQDHDKQLVSEQERQANSEGSIAISAIHGVGVLLTLLPRGDFLNEFLSELVPKLVEILDNEEHIDIAKASGRVIALCYELYTYDTNDDIENEDEEYNYNAPYYEQASLISICNRLANLSSKKIGKRDRHETHSIFRETLNTIESYTDAKKREEIYKRSPEGIEISHTLISSTHIKLAKSKSLPINSWFLYFRLLHLKWCFGFGLHNQIVSNGDIKQILREPTTEYQDKYNFDPNDSSLESGGYRSIDAKTDSERFAKTDKKRSNDLRKARVNKVTEEMNDLHLFEKTK